MKLKAFFKSKAFIVSAMVVALAGVVALCVYFNIDRTPEFVPDADLSVPAPSSWSEAVHTTKPGKGGGPADDPDAYPRVTSEDESGTMVDFAPVDTGDAEPPPAPSTSQNTTNPDQIPTYGEGETQPPAPTGPVPGQTNDQGQIWDPVFGWITPGGGNGVPVDNGGDPDKQVGDM